MSWEDLIGPGEPISAELFAAKAIENLNLAIIELQSQVEKRNKASGTFKDPSLAGAKMVVTISPFPLLLMADAVLKGDRTYPFYPGPNEKQNAKHVASRIFRVIVGANHKLLKKVRKMRKNPQVIEKHTTLQIAPDDLRLLCEGVLDGSKLQREYAEKPRPTAMKPHQSAAEPEYGEALKSKWEEEALDAKSNPFIEDGGIDDGVIDD